MDKNTIVIFSSDHGDGNGSHRWNQKSALFEEVINIPLIVRLPWKNNSGRVVNQIVSNGPDLFASICDWAGVKNVPEIPGKSFRDLVEGRSDAELHDYIVTETQFDRSETQGWALRTQRYKYVLYPMGRNREQLFDMRKDRGEMINLAVEARFSEILDEHRQLLRKWAMENDHKMVMRFIP